MTQSSNRLALVTGAGRRLGAAIALDLARKGWDLLLHCNRSLQEAEELSVRVKELGRRSQVLQADLAINGGAEDLIRGILEVLQNPQTSPLGLVVHNASFWPEDTFDTAKREAWEASHRLHSWTAVVLARLLKSHGENAQLITILDARWRDRDRGHFSYGFAKRELVGLTKLLALELAPIRVNGIAPGLVLKADEADLEAWNRAAASSPLAKTGSVDDVLRALNYLLESPYVTGQILTVDGGRHLRGDILGEF